MTDTVRQFPKLAVFKFYIMFIIIIIRYNYEGLYPGISLLMESLKNIKNVRLVIHPKAKDNLYNHSSEYKFMDKDGHKNGEFMKAGIIQNDDKL